VSSRTSSYFHRAISFYVIAVTGWLTLTLLAIYMVFELAIKETERSFQHQVAESVLDLRQKLQANEAVLSGFSAFLYAVEGSDREATMRYASAAITPYPHVYMLEVTREVLAVDRERFQEMMRKEWEPNFTLRDFTYQGARRWQEVKAKPSYWPLVFLYPDTNSVLPLYGLDVDSVPPLSQALRDAWLWQTQVVTRPFTLFEGELAYLIFQAVPRPAPRKSGDNLKPFGKALTALLVVKTSALRPTKLDPRDQVRADLLTSTTDSASPAIFMQEAMPVLAIDQMLPNLQVDTTVTVGAQSVRVQFARQVVWGDLAGFAIRAVAAISILSLTLVLLYLRRHYIAMQVADREHERAEFLAMHDPLTELPNRHLLNDRVQQALSRWQRSGAMFALFLIDLDHFKEVNDTYGHDGGDHLLKTIGRRISSTLRATDTVARYGGDEFIVLIADVLGEADAAAVGEKLLAVVAEPVPYHDAMLRVTCSLGNALCPRDGKGCGGVTQRAEKGR